MNQHEKVVIDAYEKAEQAIRTAAEAEGAPDEIATRSIARWHIKTIVDAAAPIIRRSHRFHTWRALHRITQAAEAYLTRSAEADEPRRADLRRHLADATTDAWMLLRPNSAGVGSDQDAPPAPQDEPGAANTPQAVAGEARNALRASEAVPEAVRMVARDAANEHAIKADGQVTVTDLIDAATTATWQHAHRLLTHPGRLTAADRIDTLDDLRARADRFRPHDTPTPPASPADAEPLRIAGHQPDPVPAESVLTLQDRANEAARQERAEANLAATIGAELDRGTAIREIFRSPAVQAAGFGISAAQASANIRKNLDAMLADSDTPPDLIPPADATSAAEFARYNETHPRLVDYRQRVEARRPAVKQVFTTSRLVATLDRALALLHDVLGDHWLNVPNRPPGQPETLRFADTERLAEWRQRLAAIEEATGRG